MTGSIEDRVAEAAIAYGLDDMEVNDLRKRIHATLVDELIKHVHAYADLLASEGDVANLCKLEDALLEVVDYVHAMVAHVPVTEEKNGAQ